MACQCGLPARVDSKLSWAMQDDAHDGRQALGRPRSEASKGAILSAVRSLLMEVGYARLTVEGVARRAGVSKATIYRWWRTKGELVLEAASNEISIGLVPDTGSSVDDIDAAIGQLIDTFSRPLASIVIFAAITTAGEDKVMAQIFRDSFVYPWRKSAAEALDRARDCGDVSGQDTQFLLDVIVGTVFQRTLVVKEPQIDGLKANLLRLVFGSVYVEETGSRHPHPSDDR